jgi:hypothetical protein
MSSVIRSALGAALLLTGASAAMAQGYSSPGSYQSQPAAPTAAPAPSSTPAAYQPPASNATTVAAYNAAPVAEQSPKRPHTSLCDNTDAYGGHGPNTLWGIRAFWDNQYKQ